MLKKADTIISLLLCGFSVYILYEATKFPAAFIKGAPSAARFPNILASTLLLLCIVLLIKTVRDRRNKKQEVSVQVNWLAIGKIGLCAFLVAGFLMLLETIDIFLLLPILLVSVMLIMGERSVPALITVPISFSVFVYIVFYKVFNVAFPTVYF